MAARKVATTPVEDENVNSTEGGAVEAPVKRERKPRVPKAVTDLPTASAAFKRAKRIADKADKELSAAQSNAEAAHSALTAAATELKKYTSEIATLADAALADQTEVGAESTYDETAPAEYDDYSDES